MKRKSGIIFYFLFFVFYFNAGVVLAEENSQPQQAPSLRRQAIEYASKGEFSQAKTKFQQAAEEDKSDNTSRSSLALLDDLGKNKIKNDYAIEFFKAFNNLNNGKTEEAISGFQNAISLEPSYVITYNVLGMVYASSGGLDGAVNNFQNAISLDPGYALAYFNLGSIYQAQDKLEKAIEFYAKAIQLNHKLPECYLNLGIIYASLNRYPEAIASYKKAIELEPQNPAAYYNMWLAYFMSGEYLNSRQNLLKAKELFSQQGNSEGVSNVEKYMSKFTALEQKWQESSK